MYIDGHLEEEEEEEVRPSVRPPKSLTLVTDGSRTHLTRPDTRHKMRLVRDIPYCFKMLTDGHTDGRTHGHTDGRTHPLIEMRRRI